MARPKTSLLERCCGGSYLPHKHWALLEGEPDLPVPALAELQRRARNAGDQEQRALARELKGALSGLSELERSQLEASRVGPEPRGGGQQQDSAPGTAGSVPPEAGSRESRLRAALEVALRDLLERVGSELTSSEQLSFELLAMTVERLDAIRSQVGRDGLMVTGSRGQQRAHPLLAQEIQLSRELSDRLRSFESLVSGRANRERLFPGGCLDLFPGASAVDQAPT